MQWQHLLQQGYIKVANERYDLSHLMSCILPLNIAASGKHAAISTHLFVDFQSHCVSFGTEDGAPPLDFETLGQERYLIDHRKTPRAFCFNRHRWSMQLPRIVQEIVQYKCYFTGKHNFVVVDGFDDNGQLARYEVFFDLRRLPKSDGLRMEIESAYVRTRPGLPDIASKWDRHIKFTVLAAKVYREKPLRAPPR